MELKIEDHPAVATADVQEIQVKDMQVIRAANYHTVYANVASSGLTTQDIRLTFGLITETAPRTIGVEESVTLHMPPAFAHSVAQLITRQLKAWEKLYLPPDDTATETSNSITPEKTEG